MKTATLMLRQSELRISPDSSQGEQIISIMEAYAQQYKPKWISVEDELPEEGEKVLILRFTDHILMGMLQHDDNGQIWCAFFKNSFQSCDPGSVTHWMPLPSPPTQ